MTRLGTAQREDIAPALAAEQSAGKTRIFRLAFHHIKPVAALIDAAAITATSIASGVLYHQITFGVSGNIAVFAATGCLVATNFIALGFARHLYAPAQLANASEQLRHTALHWTFIFLVLGAVAFALKNSDAFSRGTVMLFFGAGIVGITLSRIAASHYIKKALANGDFAQKRVAIIRQAYSVQFNRTLNELQQCGLSPVHVLSISDKELRTPGISKTLKQKLDELVEICRAEKAEAIFIQVDWTHARTIREVVTFLNVLPLPIQLLADDNVEALLSQRTSRFVGTALAVEMQREPLSAAERMSKRALDIVASSVGLILASPLLLLTAALIKLDSPGPVFFRQRRNGFNGQVFWIYKFRSMRVTEDGPNVRQAVRDDPRVTPIGRFLRQTSIDELPQLINVLLGDMSLVGPRPHALAHNRQYGEIVASYAFRHHVKPGITGWAQVNGFRGETSSITQMERRVQHDLWYINHWSLWLDIRIIIRTAFLFYRQPNAY